MVSDSTLDITDLLSAGFPHITITAERRHFAYECCLLNEVITKRIAALNDIRKGMQSVTVLGNTVSDLLLKWPELQKKLFPEAQSETVNASELASRVLYAMDDINASHDVRAFFEKYINELEARSG